jgi:type VI secretion system protein ImpH
MAESGRMAPRALEIMDTLAERAVEFGFFEAVRWIEAAFPEKPRIGTSAHASQDPVRFGQDPSLVFAPTEIASFTPGGDGRPPRLAGYFFGLLGPNGPLPLHLTEYARERLRNAGDPTFARFLDLFHHRMLSLFYRAWAIHEPTVSFSRPGDDRYAAYVGALFGLGMPSLRGRDAFPDLARLHFAGIFSAQTRHAAGLRAVLQGFFGMPVAIREFVGAWLELPRDQRWRLGESPRTGTLGRTAAAGARVWDCQHKFRIVFGPLALADYRRLLPGGDSLRRLLPLVRFYAGDELLWDVSLILRGDEVPAPCLGREGRLGWTTWLPARGAGRDRADLRLNPHRTYPTAASAGIANADALGRPA